MVYDAVGKAITAVEWLDGNTAIYTLDDGTTIEAHHIKIVTKDVQIATMEAEVAQMQEDIALKTAKLDVLKGDIVFDTTTVATGTEVQTTTEVIGNPPLEI